jgi:hypothetical protein
MSTSDNITSPMVVSPSSVRAKETGVDLHPRERSERGSPDATEGSVRPFSSMFFKERFAAGEPDAEKDRPTSV